MPLGHISHSLRFERFGDFLRILIRHQAKAEFRARPRRQNRFGSFALIAAGEPVDIERRPGAAAFQRGESFFAGHRVDADLLLELPLRQTATRRIAAARDPVSGITSS